LARLARARRSRHATQDISQVLSSASAVHANSHSGDDTGTEPVEASSLFLRIAQRAGVVQVRSDDHARVHQQRRSEKRMKTVRSLAHTEATLPRHTEEQRPGDALKSPGIEFDEQSDQAVKTAHQGEFEPLVPSTFHPSTLRSADVNMGSDEPVALALPIATYTKAGRSGKRTASPTRPRSSTKRGKISTQERPLTLQDYSGPHSKAIVPRRELSTFPPLHYEGVIVSCTEDLMAILNETWEVATAITASSLLPRGQASSNESGMQTVTIDPADIA
jgi:hypothetical protein